MVLIIVGKCKCGHTVLDHNNYKKTFCYQCDCEEYKEVKERKKDIKRALREHENYLKRVDQNSKIL